MIYIFFLIFCITLDLSGTEGNVRPVLTKPHYVPSVALYMPGSQYLIRILPIFYLI